MCVNINPCNVLVHRQQRQDREADALQRRDQRPGGRGQGPHDARRDGAGLLLRGGGARRLLPPTLRRGRGLQGTGLYTN